MWQPHNSLPHCFWGRGLKQHILTFSDLGHSQNMGACTHRALKAPVIAVTVPGLIRLRHRSKSAAENHAAMQDSPFAFGNYAQMCPVSAQPDGREAVASSIWRQKGALHPENSYALGAAITRRPAHPCTMLHLAISTTNCELCICCTSRWTQVGAGTTPRRCPKIRTRTSEKSESASEDHRTRKGAVLKCKS